MTDRLLLGPSNSVTVFDNFSSGETGFLHHIPRSERFQLIMGDLLDSKLLQQSIGGHDIVFHFASNPNIARGAEDPTLDLQQSVVATHNVLEAMRHTGVRKLVFLSGSGVYGDVGGKPTDEDFGPLLPVSMYGAGKLGAEAFISAFAQMFEIRSYIFRPANIVGARQTHGVAFDFIKQLSAHPAHLEVLGDGRQSKSYLHVDDLLDAIFFVLAMVEERVNVYNVATQDAIEVAWIARAVIETMGLSDVQINYAGGSKGWPGDVPVVRLNTDKIRRFGWTPKYDSSQAMKLAITQMLDRLRQGTAQQEAR